MSLQGALVQGKSTLIHALKKRGFACFEEVARQIIQEQVSILGDAVPWKNMTRFKEMMLLRSIENYKLAMDDAKKITFFDRDILDLIAYDRLTKTEISQDLQNAFQNFLYNKRIFIAPPWKEIYCNDMERKQTYEEAVEIYHNLVEVYSEYGRELIELPKTSVENRVEFIIKFLNFF